jgi:2-keto-3-deoxy-L-rhamnonate aldolase RhmA
MKAINMSSKPASLIPQNTCKRKLKSGASVVGTFVVEIRQPAVMQLLANAGFDFVLIDNEHGAFSIETIADLSRTAVLLGLTPIVRIPDFTHPHINQTLDVGAQGLMVPQIRYADEVRQIMRWMRYPPQGERGNAMERGLTQFRSGSVPQALEDIHDETMLVIQVETLEAIDSIDEIVSIPGVDAALIGPNDLSIALGVPGEVEHPRVQQAIQKTIQACLRAGVAPAIHMPRIELAAYWAGQGMRMISTGSEASFIMRAGKASVETLRSAFS